MHISLRWQNYQGGKIQKNKVDLLKEQYLNNNIFLSTHEGQDVYSVMIWNMNKKKHKNPVLAYFAWLEVLPLCMIEIIAVKMRHLISW